jgi:hypothetical protein
MTELPFLDERNRHLAYRFAARFDQRERLIELLDGPAMCNEVTEPELA